MIDESKIQTLHPDPSKEGVNISKSKYLTIKNFIMKTIDQEKEISYEALNDSAEKALGDTFDGSVTWYIVTVKLDLEARNIIKRKKAKGSHLVTRV